MTEITNKKEKIPDTMEEISIITTPRLHRGRAMNYMFMFDSKAPDEYTMGYDYWGMLYQNEGQWIMNLFNSSGHVLGGGFGRVEKGLDNGFLRKIERNFVLLVQKSDFNLCKNDLKEVFTMKVFNCEFPLHSMGKDHIKKNQSFITCQLVDCLYNNEEGECTHEAPRITIDKDCNGMKGSCNDYKP